MEVHNCHLFLPIPFLPTSFPNFRFLNFRKVLGSNIYLPINFALCIIKLAYLLHIYEKESHCNMQVTDSGFFLPKSNTFCLSEGRNYFKVSQNCCLFRNKPRSLRQTAVLQGQKLTDNVLVAYSECLRIYQLRLSLLRVCLLGFLPGMRESIILLDSWRWTIQSLEKAQPPHVVF